MSNSLLFKDDPKLLGRDPKFKDLDRSALYAIVQAAVNVELFTIPLYMTSLYSIFGTHQITGKNDFYQGRLWPGMTTKVDPASPNGQAFNAVFSVFIAEMLHLQLASNLCKAVGYSPIYTSLALQNANFGWTCYGDDLTVLPHILDFLDTDDAHKDIKVKLGALNAESIALFLAIEETEDLANGIIVRNKDKYVSTVPFAKWTQTSTEKDLPYFSSIGGMYLRLWEYLSIEYLEKDGRKTTLWDYVFTKSSVQQDVFNSTSDHEKEYPKMAATIASNNAGVALEQALDMINGITDQGEGGGVVHLIRQRSGNIVLQAVEHQYQPSKAAMEANYPSYTDMGEKEKHSKDAYARHHYGSKDHYETFELVKGLLPQIKTWDQWHAAGNKWTPEMLKTAEYTKDKYAIPAPEAVAGALNRLKQTDGDKNFIKFSHTAAGAIAGVTRVLNDYFNNPKGTFPYPSMSGSGDRMAICWAIFGKAPKLDLGIIPKTTGILYHACQGLNLDPTQPTDMANCAAVEVFHTCKGSNDCKAEGGCGFVQSVNGGGGCSSSAANSFKKGPLTDNGMDNYYSAPSDNRCQTFGGCAIPMSASQIFPITKPQLGMQLYDFLGTDFTPAPFATLPYETGDFVYDTAWNAYCEVLKKRGKPVPEKMPPPSDIRLAFPPST